MDQWGLPKNDTDVPPWFRTASADMISIWPSKYKRLGFVHLLTGLVEEGPEDTLCPL